MDNENTLNFYMEETAKVITSSDAKTLTEISDALMDAKRRGVTVFTAGNGGSAATASHTANDLLKGCRVNGKPGFKAVCLADSTPIVTCLSNDFCYEDIFSIQLETYAEKGDILILFSGSGNSENIVRAAKYAKSIGLIIIGFLGRDGGKTLPYCDLAFIARTDCMEMIEDAHLAAEHALTAQLRARLAAE